MSCLGPPQLASDLVVTLCGGRTKNLQLSLDQQRNVYRDFAFIGSNLFMVFGDLIKMNNMY